MDIYLTAASSALSSCPLSRNDHALVPSEDIYYAQHAWSPTVPAWIGRLIALVRGTRGPAPERAPMARHA